MTIPLAGSTSNGGRTPGERAEVPVLLVLDSTVLIDYLRGLPVVARVNELERSGDIPMTTAVNVEEVVRGLRPREVEAATRLFEGLDVLPIVEQDAWRAGGWRREYSGRGLTLGQADCLVAAVALHVGACVATGNPEDFPMPELTVEHWPVGE